VRRPELLTGQALRAWVGERDWELVRTKVGHDSGTGCGDDAQASHTGGTGLDRAVGGEGIGFALSQPRAPCHGFSRLMATDTR
jgi:hypothetical protein